MWHGPAARRSNDFRMLVKAFCACERGSTAIEYSVIASIIVIAIVGSVSAIGEVLKTKFYEPVAAGFGGGSGGDNPPS